MISVEMPVHPGTRVPASIDALILDLDGVLLDTERIWGIAEAALCRHHGVGYGPADERATHGLLIVDSCRYYARRFGLPETDWPQLERELLDLMAIELQGPVPTLPGALPLLDRLAGRVKLGIASNSRRVVVDRALAQAGLASAFDVVVSADDVERAKPAPDLYRLACLRLGIEPRRALAIEDSTIGATAAVAAGCVCYLLSPAAPSEAIGVSRWIQSLEQLLAFPAGMSAGQEGVGASTTNAQGGSPRR
jgi:HAD superfamily hydrolase (TIGR01509 family)